MNAITPIEVLADKLELAEARNAALADALAQLVAYVRRENSFMEHRDQLVIRHAEALLAEAV